MATTTHAAAELSTPNTAPLRWARLGSLMSMLPLGVWTVNHLWDNLAAFRGEQAWQQSVTSYAHPVSHFLTMLVVLLPLVLHTVWGIQRMRSFKPNNGAYPNFDNFKYLLQRITAAGAFLFIGAHLWLATFKPRLVDGHAEQFADIAQQMHFHVPTLLVYLLGTLGVAYHLGNGLFSFAWTWGITTGRKSFKSIQVLSIVAFLVLLAMSWGTIFALYQAGAQFGPPAEH